MYQEWKYEEYRQVGKDYSRHDEVARYDASHAQFRDVRAENAALLAKLDLGGNVSLLDIGCGTGDFAIAAANHCASVVGIDVSEAMLERARSKARAPEAGRLEFRKAGYLDFDSQEASFDVVTSSFSLHHLPDYWKGVALEKIFQCLKEGGVFFLRDVVMPDASAAAVVFSFIEQQERRGGAFLKEDAIGHFRDEFSTYGWIMGGLLERAGFVIETQDTIDSVVCEYTCRKTT